LRSIAPTNHAQIDFLKPLRLRVGAIWHSDRVRAVQSARILSGAIGFSEKMIQLSYLGPDDSIAPAVRSIRKARGDVMIVGHLPFLGKLASKFLTRKPSDEILKLSTSSIVALRSDDGRKWAVEWLLAPSLIQSL